LMREMGRPQKKALICAETGPGRKRRGEAGGGPAPPYVSQITNTALIYKDSTLFSGMGDFSG
jgi:hypothetical protein